METMCLVHYKVKKKIYNCPDLIKIDIFLPAVAALFVSL